MNREIVILGSGGHARVVADACNSTARSIAGFIGPDAGSRGVIEEGVHLGGDECLEDGDFVHSHDFVVGVGSQQRRAELSRMLCNRGARLATVVHASAVVAPSATLGPGTVVFAGAVVNPGARLGGWVIVNTNATVDHDARLADGVHVCPGAALAGDVTCGENAFIGTGASVSRGIEIGARAVVGAGAVVIDDVVAGATVVGVPAREMRSR